MKGVRPTTSIVIEAIFNILGPLSNVAFLDLFAGTGRVALEAWSRGARPVVAVELLRRRCEAVKRAGVKPEEGLVLLFMDVRRAIRWLYKRGYSFNVIFADPPYDSSWATETLELLTSKRGLVRPGGVIMLERSSREIVNGIPKCLQLVDERRYGDTVLSTFRFAEGD